MEPHLQTRELYIAVIAGTLLFLMFSGFVIMYVIMYWRRRVRYEKEVEKMKSLYAQEMLKARLEVQEQTLNYLSSEIHDNVGQLLSLAQVQVHLLQQQPNTATDLLEALRENLSQAMEDLRGLAHSLNSEWVKASSLEKRIIEEIHRVQKAGLLRFDLKIEGPERAIDKQHTLICFRLFQESVQNILKHAHANRVQVDLSYATDQLILRIQDNGSGFSMSDTDGLGLQTMHQRATLLQGTLQVTSETGMGTIVQLNLPYE